jgi:hypothetical protein
MPAHRLCCKISRIHAVATFDLFRLYPTSCVCGNTKIRSEYKYHKYDRPVSLTSAEQFKVQVAARIPDGHFSMHIR